MSSIRDRAAATTLANSRVHIPEWGVDVEVRSLSLEQVDELSQGSDGNRFRDASRLVVAAVYDPETGAPAFTDEDVPMLMGQSAGVMERLAAAVTDVSSLGEDAVKVGKGGS